MIEFEVEVEDVMDIFVEDVMKEVEVEVVEFY